MLIHYRMYIYCTYRRLDTIYLVCCGCSLRWQQGRVPPCGEDDLAARLSLWSRSSKWKFYQKTKQMEQRCTQKILAVDGWLTPRRRVSDSPQIGKSYSVLI